MSGFRVNLLAAVAALSVFAAFAGSSGPVSAAPSPGFEACAASLPLGVPGVEGRAQVVAICHQAYAAAVDQDLKIPRWVSYVLTAEHSIGCLKRTDDFHAEDGLGRSGAQPEDYARSGFDRGHQAPADDFAWDPAAMHDSFSMANMAPQVPGLNRKEWEKLEEDVRGWALERGELEIYVGPVMGQKFDRIGFDGVAVPIGFWKVVVDPNNHQAIGFMMPQRDIPKGDLSPWVVPINDIERVSGVDLPIPSDIDTAGTPRPWKSNVAGWRRLKSKTCG